MSQIQTAEETAAAIAELISTPNFPAVVTHVADGLYFLVHVPALGAEFDYEVMVQNVNGAITYKTV
jgi:hypothetical protein